jgi:cobalt/nickel transport system permease protein
MHIPDGYLSPSTCAVLWAAALPFWSAALRRVRQVFSSRFIPLVSLSAAFSFVIMMFNIPLPGGTTGHAAGVAIAAIVVGPWGAILAISVALAIQALLFGDGGVLALGANCFNIAIAGSLVAWGVYRLLAGASPLTSRRRMLAAGVAGYLAMNAAALLTALQLGIQPALFRDASGMPLYAPYPLWIAVPAMMIGHITIAGFAEGAITAGIVAYLQRAKPSLLQLTSARTEERFSAWRSLRPLWVGLAVLLILTPLGLIASGTAWGEWAPEDFDDPAGRQEIAAGSLNAALPGERAPEGLRRWSALWDAPIPDYAPPLLRSETAGYVLSGMLGVGLILALALLLDGVTAARRRRGAALT